MPIRRLHPRGELESPVAQVEEARVAARRDLRARDATRTAARHGEDVVRRGMAMAVVRPDGYDRMLRGDGIVELAELRPRLAKVADLSAMMRYADHVGATERRLERLPRAERRITADEDRRTRALDAKDDGAPIRWVAARKMNRLLHVDVMREHELDLPRLAARDFPRFPFSERCRHLKAGMGRRLVPCECLRKQVPEMNIAIFPEVPVSPDNKRSTRLFDSKRSLRNGNMPRT